MLLDEMKTALRKIFGLKVSFDTPEDGESIEQDTLFVSLDDSPSRAGDAVIRHRITGTLRVYSEIEKLPPGFFARKIEQADVELANPFFFFNIEQSTPKYQNIWERTAQFLYLSSEQYNPNQGKITSVEFSEEDQ